MLEPSWEESQGKRRTFLSRQQRSSNACILHSWNFTFLHSFGMCAHLFSCRNLGVPRISRFHRPRIVRARRKHDDYVLNGHFHSKFRYPWGNRTSTSVLALSISVGALLRARRNARGGGLAYLEGAGTAGSEQSLGITLFREIMSLRN